MSDHKPPETHTRKEPGNEWSGDVKSLERALKEKNSDEVRFDDDSRAL